MANADRIYGKTLPETIDPPQRVCFVIEIPDTLEYRAALMGQLEWLTDWRCWEHTEADYAYTPTRNKQAAALWLKQLVDTGKFGDCMDCDNILECLETNDAIRAFLSSFIQGEIGNTPGTPLSDRQLDTPLQNNAGNCDLDVLWGSCLYTVQILNRLNEDFFEQIEALTNNQEMLAYIVGAIPILETLPIDEFIELADKVREFVRETYEAGYDVDYEQTLACGLFCAARANDCILDMRVLTSYFFTKAQTVEGFENAFETAKTIISAMASWQEVLGEQIVDTMMAANVGFLSFLNSAFGMDFGTFALQAKSGIPDDDWQALCTDCPDVGGCYTQAADFVNLLSGTWVTDTVYGRVAKADANGGLASFEMEFTTPQTLVSFSVFTAVQTASIAWNTVEVLAYLGGSLIGALFSNVNVNDGGYPFPGRGAINSTVGAGTVFDKIVWRAQHTTGIASIAGDLCVEGPPPSSCADCGTFADQIVSVNATYNGTVWIPDDTRINAESQSQYGGTYIAMTSSSGTNELFFNADNAVCSSQVKIYANFASVSGTLEVVVNGYTYSQPASGSGATITTFVFDEPVPVASMVIRFASGTGSMNITQLRIAECAD